MFVDEMTRIKDSEAKADDIIKNAKLKVKQDIAEAKAESEKILEDAENKAKEIYDNLIAQGQTQAAKEYDGFMADKKAECEALISKARDNEDKAVTLIAERIVRDSVNS